MNMNIDENHAIMSMNLEEIFHIYICCILTNATIYTNKFKLLNEETAFLLEYSVAY